MSVMIERVALAMVGGVPWTHPQQRQYWMEKAEAAIEAMLDPTEEMMRAGEDDRWDEQVDFVWRAMIREALRCE